MVGLAGGGCGATRAWGGRRGGAEALRSSAPGAPGGVWHGAGAGQDGRSGPRLGCAPRPAGGSEDLGPRSQRPPGHLALSSEGDGGWGGGGSRRAGAGVEGPRVGWRRDIPQPTPPPHPTPLSRTPRWPLRVPEALWAPGPGRAGAGRGWGCAWGRGGLGRPGVRSRGVRPACSARSVESCERLAPPAGQSARQAQRRLLRAPGGSRLRLRPYHPERARSRLISEAKQGRAWLVLGWETAWEYRVL